VGSAGSRHLRGAAHRQGAYAGREIEWVRQEIDIFRAQREGRVLGGVTVAGK
jgi:hypothetical protein